MSHGFRETLEHLLKARFPLLYIESYEEPRIIAEITAVATDAVRMRTPRKVVTWSLISGLMRSDGSTITGTTEAVKALDVALRADEPTVFIFRDLHSTLGHGNRPVDAAVVRRLREAAFAFKNSPVALTLILTSPVLAIPPDLEKDVTIVDFPLPGEDEIRSLLDGMIASNIGGRIRIDIDDDGREKLAKAAQGLTTFEAENAFARAMVNDGTLSVEDIDVVLEEKQQTIRKSGLLEFIPVDVELDDVGGLQNLKRWLSKRNDSWLAEARAYGLPAPKGVLITGVPGCGKSLTAKAIAAAWGLPLLRLDIGRVFAGLVGSSEQNMRTGIRTAEAIAPCVLWIDEVEKGFSGAGGGGDSGTSSRVFGSFLTWMQEKTAPVFVIATANSIDRLPPEFLRKGRFDEIFFVDLPTRVERAAIWDLQIRKRVRSGGTDGEQVLAGSAGEALADASEGYSGAEIEQAVIAGLFDAFAERRPVNHADLRRAVSNMVPLSVTQSEQIAQIRAWADVRAVAATATEDRGDYTTSNTAPSAPPNVSGERDPSNHRPVTTAPSTRGGRTVDF